MRSDARDNRTRILAVAASAFASEGFDVPIREIARRAEVGAATVYRHFPSKEALLCEVVAGGMASCSEIVHRGLAAHDPWTGFCTVVEQLMMLHALDHGFARVFGSPATEPPEFAAERARTLRALIGLVGKAKDAGSLRSDFSVEDIKLALMANEGIRAGSPRSRATASRRLAALLLQAFHTDPVRAPLPPAVPLPPFPVLP